MPDPFLLLTVPEVAERLRVSRRTVERLIRDGRIRSVRIGRRVLVTEREVGAFVATCARRLVP
jgi:excisionase family DNA binding protein